MAIKPKQGLEQDRHGWNWDFQLLAIRGILSEVMKDYMKQTSLHGYRYLSEPGRHWFERLVWLVVHVAAMAGVIYQVQSTYHDYRTQEAVTTVQSMHYHINNVNYPAVAVCDVNKMRRSRVKNLAKRLIQDYKMNYTSNELTGALRYLGRLYDTSMQNSAEVERLQGIFDKYNVTLNIGEEMERLMSKCDELLLACKWEGRVYNSCSELFEPRKTMEGFCCAFNYVRSSDSFDLRLATKNGTEKPNSEIEQTISPKRSLISGPQTGLSVLVNSNFSDYFYPLLPTIGVKLLIFNPHDYPDTASGGLIEKLVMSRQEVFFTLSAVVTHATPAVQDLPIDRRKCLFPAEQVSTLSGHYSYSDCLMECRVRSIRSLCGCLPFFSPNDVTLAEIRACDLNDIRCLNKHMEMWQTLRPEEYKPGLEVEMTQSLSCLHCFPACGDTVYSVQSTGMPLQQVLMDHQKPFLKGVEIHNQSLFHLYFGTTSQTLMKKSVLIAWYDLLSNIGGICGVFVGFSVMSVIEFFYFFTVRALILLWGRRHDNDTASSAKMSSDPAQGNANGARLSPPHGLGGPAFYRSTIGFRLRQNTSPVLP